MAKESNLLLANNLENEEKKFRKGAFKREGYFGWSYDYRCVRKWSSRS